MEPSIIQSNAPLTVKTASACDTCRSRKVRCIIQKGEKTCAHCTKRGDTCRFSHYKRKVRQVTQRSGLTASSRVSALPTSFYPHARTPAEMTRLDLSPSDSVPLDSSPAPDSSPSTIPTAWPRHVSVLADSNGEPHQEWGPDKLYNRLHIDDLLGGDSAANETEDQHSIVKVGQHHVASSCIAYFSDHKIKTLSRALGHDKLRGLINSLETSIMSRVQIDSGSSFSPIKFDQFVERPILSQKAIKVYIEGILSPFKYFTNIHPMYPFLDRSSFEEKAFRGNLRALLECPAFSALYHAVLALGSVHHNTSDFEPCRGGSWELYQVCLGSFSSLVTPNASLLNLQALIAMTIFALNWPYIQLQEVLTMETSRLAQRLRYHKDIRHSDEQTHCQLAFWVVYVIEKHVCFHNRLCTSIADEDVSCPVPRILLSTIGRPGFDSFLCSIRLARLQSLAYSLLFTATASRKPVNTVLSTIELVRNRLEDWRVSIPYGIRPEEDLQTSHLSSQAAMTTTLLIHYSYYSLVIGIARLNLHLCSQNPGNTRGLEESKKELTTAARAIIESTRCIVPEPQTQVFILGVMPLAALFILFDFVVHNPEHGQTKTNLALLEVLSGYFALLDYKSRGKLFGPNPSGFVQIAREYVQHSSTTGLQQQQRQAFTVADEPAETASTYGVRPNSDPPARSREFLGTPAETDPMDTEFTKAWPWNKTQVQSSDKTCDGTNPMTINPEHQPQQPLPQSVVEWRENEEILSSLADWSELSYPMIDIFDGQISQEMNFAFDIRDLLSGGPSNLARY
ncbi:hypothetical protein BKA56DRAFT_664098 [Ilyonectria sp. MPI-CAGE-AT-0026]|nr:hypothetical protein BKA56DRAFT_664098 [Ilyonectria sp. MPI-CAGE-AT-0026]